MTDLDFEVNLNDSGVSITPEPKLKSLNLYSF